MNTLRLSARIDEETGKKLQYRARIEGKDESEVVREALRAYLSTEKESVHAALTRIGGIGIAKGLPSDLSTNRKHFEGFGRSDHPRPTGHRSARRAPRGR
jgi:Arc/MetJ-type ribon-helix-helix transcriptional regulator